MFCLCCLAQKTLLFDDSFLVLSSPLNSRSDKYENDDLSVGETNDTSDEIEVRKSSSEDDADWTTQWNQQMILVHHYYPEFFNYRHSSSMCEFCVRVLYIF